jgi:hypothetical protein
MIIYLHRHVRPTGNKERGTRLHAFAAECIKLKQTLPRSHKTLNMYVNDAIGYRMNPDDIDYVMKIFAGRNLTYYCCCVNF